VGTWEGRGGGGAPAKSSAPPFAPHNLAVTGLFRTHPRARAIARGAEADAASLRTGWATPPDARPLVTERKPGIMAIMNREPTRLRYAQPPKRDPWAAPRQRWHILSLVLILLLLLLVPAGYALMMVLWWLGTWLPPGPSW
jgi:hypothetical protein